MKQNQFKPTCVSRRRFIGTAAVAGISTALGYQRCYGANDTVRIGLIGAGRRAQGLLKTFITLPGVELVAISDPDTAQMDKLMASIEKIKQSASEAGKSFPDVKPQLYQDYRKLYDRQDIDAVIVPSTNYWHTLHAIHGVQADKHVYVEKPVTFTHWEGSQLQAAAERYGKVIAPGYQNRSDPGPQEGIRYVQEGNLGKILKVRALCLKNRDSIGIREKALQPPATMDYNLWLGPAQDQPIMRPEIHYDWHWDFNTGNGDMGNQSVHEIDMVYWLLGHPGLPEEVRSFGNRFVWNDAGNTPNMQTVWCNWGGAEVILETNDIKISPTRNVSPNRLGVRIGIIAECEKGILKGGRGGMMAVELDGKTRIERFPGNGGLTHTASFIEAVRANDASKFPVSVEQAHVSESVMHLGNASYRMGELQAAKDIETELSHNSDLREIISDQNKQLSAWGVESPEYFMGTTIKIDPKSGNVLTKEVGPELTGPRYRKGFEVPDLAGSQKRSKWFNLF